MGQAIPRQHQAVGLRFRNAQPRYLLAAAMIALVGLCGAAVIVANGDRDEVTGTSATQSAESANPVGSPRYFKGVAQPTIPGTTTAPAPGTRPDGGPEEGTRGVVSP